LNVSIYKGKRAPSFIIGSGPKAEVDLTTRRIVPGPGNYNVKMLSKSGISFTKSMRDKLKNDGVPGPG
jgi:hypothetical protein